MSSGRTAEHTRSNHGERGGERVESRLSGIERRETLRYLQYRGGTLGPEIAAALDRGEQKLLETARPRTVWRLFEREADGRLAGTDFTPEGRDVAALLTDCDQVILMAATLGTEAERLLRQAQARDMAEAVILDAAGSAAIESVCDALCDELAARFKPRYLTERFSPGYGDMPLKQQRALCRVLSLERSIGVSLTESGLMIPQKSVTALIGVSDRPQPRRPRGCETCAARETCTYRKEGTDCGKG